MKITKIIGYISVISMSMFFMWYLIDMFTLLDSFRFGYFIPSIILQIGIIFAIYWFMVKESKK